MPDYDHICTNTECNHEWEDSYSIKTEPPTHCPKCNNPTAKRVISLCGKGVVELFGQDLVDKVKADAKNIERNAYKSEKTYANLIGESRYQNLQTKMDRNK